MSLLNGLSEEDRGIIQRYREMCEFHSLKNELSPNGDELIIIGDDGKEFRREKISAILKMAKAQHVG